MVNSNANDGADPLKGIEPEHPASEADGEHEEHHEEHHEEGEEGDTFPRAYVEKLREEAGEHRVRAKDAEARSEALEAALQALAVEHHARGILSDPSALQWAPELAGEDGLPDGEKIRAAAEALVVARPYLGRPRGDVLAGEHGETKTGFSWGVLSGLV